MDLFNPCNLTKSFVLVHLFKRLISQCSQNKYFERKINVVEYLMVRMQNRNRLSCKQFIIVSYVTSTNFNGVGD